MSKIFCPDCGQPFDGEFALSYHRKIAHQVEINIDIDELEKAKKRINTAGIAGMISGTITTIFSLTRVFDFSPWSLIDAGLAFGLSIGVFMKNRACAIILFIYWIIEKLFQIFTTDLNVFGLFVATLFGVLFFQGILGTFSYRRLVHSHVANTPGEHDLTAATRELQKNYVENEKDKQKDFSEHILSQ